jgi:hypothetical protein
MDINNLILNHLPSNRRVSPRGWIIYNSVCCHHRGHRPDTRMRGNLKLGMDGNIGGNCYNCGFKFRFDGIHLSDQFEQWLYWLGCHRSDIQKLKLFLLSKNIDGETGGKTDPTDNFRFDWEPIDLPKDSENIIGLLESGNDDPDFHQAITYLAGRGTDILNGHDYFWCNSSKHNFKNRILIPFYHNGAIVGWSGRYTGSPPAGVPRYWNSPVPQGYLFNQDVLHIPGRKYAIVNEGPFDAIATQGIATLGARINEYQIMNLQQSHQEPIILPDRQSKNQDLIDIALSFGWWVSFPDWEQDIKDAADACKRYGQVYTITSTLAARTQNPLEIGIKRKQFFMA